MLRYKLSNIKINVHRYITDKKFFNDKKKIKKTECPFKRFWYSTKNTMGNSVKARFTRLPSAIFF